MDKSWSLRGLTVRGIHLPATGPSRANLLTLHGWLDNAASFLPLARCLPEYDWYLLDLPGHGLSDWQPPGQIYHFIDWVAEVWELIEWHLPHPITLVAHSMGAGIAPLVAGAEPDQVERLVLLDGLGPLSSPAHEAPQLLRKALQLLRKESQPRVYATRQEVAEAIARSRDLTVEQAEPLVERAVRELPEGGWVLRHDGRLKWSSRQRITEEQLTAHLQAVTQPALLLTPEQGMHLRYPESVARAGHVKNLKVQAFPGGHHAHLETPEVVASLLRAWWR